MSQLDATITPDRAKDWQEARAQLPTFVRARHQAEAALASSQQGLDDARCRRWGGLDHEAINAGKRQVGMAEQDLERAVVAERHLGEYLARILSHQQERQHAITDSAPKRQELETAMAQFDAALDRTRPQRVQALLSHTSPELIECLSEPPASVAGQAVWCHHALPIEADLDRNDGVSPPWTGWSQQTDRARQEIKIADQLLDVEAGDLKPTEWAELAQQAATIREQALRDLKVRNTFEQTISLTRQAEHHLGIDYSAGPRGPEIGL
jgi:hypothetical protein